MKKLLSLLVAVVLVIAACGDDSDAAPPATGQPAELTSTTTVPTSQPPTTTADATTTTTTSTTTAPTTTSTTSPPVTTTPPDVGRWDALMIEQIVSPQCCDVPVIAPASPAGPLPDTGWPADGFYDVTATRPAEPGNMVDLVIRRWVPCADLPDRCSPDPPAGGVTPDPDDSMTRALALDDSIAVVLWPLWTFFDDGPTALVGSGTDLALMLANGLDVAYRQWVVTPFEAGTSVEDIVADLTVRSDDPAFPFGRDASGWEGFVYRAPEDARPTVQPGSLLEHAEPWPPGYNGLYDWWVTLEIRGGAPVLYLYANQIAG